MSYCEIADVLHELHPTLKLGMQRDYGDDFENVIANHIIKAEDFVNASLARAYSVPLKKATSVVISAECKIAAYFASAAYSEKEKILSDKYETAMNMLDNLVKADLITLVDEEAESTLANSKVHYGSDNQIFSSEALKLW